MSPAAVAVQDQQFSSDEPQLILQVAAQQSRLHHRRLLFLAQPQDHWGAAAFPARWVPRPPPPGLETEPDDAEQGEGDAGQGDEHRGAADQGQYQQEGPPPPSFTTRRRPPQGGARQSLTHIRLCCWCLPLTPWQPLPLEVHVATYPDFHALRSLIYSCPLG